MLKKLLEKYNQYQESKILKSYERLIKVYERRIELLEDRCKILEGYNENYDKMLDKSQNQTRRVLDLYNQTMSICKN